MKVIVKLFGTLAQEFSGYNREEGMDIELPDGSKVKDLLAHLQILKSQGDVVSMRGRILKENDKLEDGALVYILQAVHGG